MLLVIAFVSPRLWRQLTNDFLRRCPGCNASDHLSESSYRVFQPSFAGMLRGRSGYWQVWNDQCPTWLG
eukprot:7690755-Lingulodinium_polyedra.AAC.1